MRILILTFILSFSINQILGQVYTKETISDPKKNGGGYVSDPDGLLSEVTINQLNSLLKELEDSTSAQAAVVIVNSIGEEVPKDLATSLFNHWGIGQADKDNGFLLLVVMDQRRMEMETGYGTETVLTDIICKRIQETYMVPLFKEGRYEEGIVQGMVQVCAVLKDPSAIYLLNEMGENAGSDDLTGIFWILSGFYFLPMLIMFFITRKNKLFTHLHNQANNKYRKHPPIPLSRWLLIYIGLPLVLLIFVSFTGEYLWFLILVYLMIILFFLEKRIRHNAFIKRNSATDPYVLYKINKESHSYWGILAFLIPVPFLFYYIGYKLKQRSLRNAPRICEKCNQKMKKLNESSDDAFLKQGQIVEEKIRAIDYDVWNCESCNNQKVQSYINFWSKYKNCSSCNYKTFYLYMKETLVPATYSSSGSGLNTYLCKNCNHIETETFTIPRLQRSSSSGSGSSSGGSWGGGSSGGGGAGSSW